MKNINSLTLCLLGNVSCFLSSVDFFQNQFFRKILSGIHVSSECQTVWIQILPNILSSLIWVQTVCKGYQQTALVGKELMRTIQVNWGVDEIIANRGYT